MAMPVEERRRRGVIASQKWRSKNLERALAADRIRRKKYYAANREKVIAANKAWREANPEKLKSQWKRQSPRIKAWRLKHKYGLSVQQWKAIFAAQGNACAICRSVTGCGKGLWALDHDHATGAVRGILCSRCNTGLGLLGDDAERLAVAIEYLARAHAGTAVRSSGRLRQ